MRKVYILLLVSFACLSVLNAQVSVSKKNAPIGRRSTNSEKWTANGTFYGFKPEQEVLERRNRNAKHFRNANGTFTVQAGGVYHYKDANGAWQDIDLSIQSNSSRNNYSISNESNEFKSYFPSKAGASNMLMALPNNVDFKWWQNPRFSLTSNGNVIKSSPASSAASNASFSKNKLTYPSVYNSVSEEFIMLQNGIENNTIIHSLSSEINSLPINGMLEFSQFIPLQTGWSVDVNGENKSTNFTAADFHIAIPKTEMGIFFSPIIVFDNELTQSEAILIWNMPTEKRTNEQKEKKEKNIYQCSYDVRFVNGGIEVITKLPASWLKVSGRSFPVTIDPTVTVTPPGLISGGDYHCPTSNWYGYQRHADLYLASEIGVSNISISAIEFNRVTTAGTNASKPLKVYMRSTPATTLTGTDAWNSATYTGGLTALYDGSLDFHGTTTGFKMVTLTTPFIYSSDNLMVMVYDAYGGGGSAKYMNLSSTVAGRQAFKRQDTNDPGDASAMAVENYLIETRLTYTFAAACTNPPTGGTASSNLMNVCAGNPFTLSVTGTSTGSNLTYQWQSSPDNVNWSDIASATSLALITTQTVSTYYRFKIVCSGGTPGYSNSIQVVSPTLYPGGTYTINASSPTGGTNFINFTDAFNAINCGIAGPIIFNVPVNQTFDEILPPLTVHGTSTNTVTFRKFGSGANPVITRNDAGTLATSTFGGNGDAIIILEGSDYVTFDGIDVQSTNQGIEYGYLLRKASGSDGCKNVAIKNANITMAKGTSVYVTGIYSSNLDATAAVSSSTNVTVTAIAGRHESVTITGNTISNTYYGIQLRGYAHGAVPYNFYDTAFVVGASGTGNGNIINNFGGNTTTGVYGIFVLQHNNPMITYNTINNTDNGGVPSTATMYGIYQSTATNATFTASYNIISLTSAYTSGSLYGVYNSAGTGNLIVNNNAISLNNAATSSGVFGFIYNASATAATSVSFNNNSFENSTIASSGTIYLISNSVVNGALTTIQNNLINGNITTTGSAATYCYYNASAATGTDIFSGNVFSNITCGSSFYGYYTATGASHRRNAYSNVFSTIVAAGNTVYPIYKASGGISNIYKNKIYDVTSNGTGSAVYGIYITAGTKDSVYNNIISDLKAPTASAANAVAGIYSSSTSATSTLGIYYNTINLAANSSGANFGTSGIYAATSTTATTATLEMKNNIVVNASSANGTGIVAAFRRSSATLTNFASTSNNNLFYITAPSSNTVIFYDGTNLDQNLSDYKTRVSPRESASISENPYFISTIGTDPTFLHINTSSATQIESGGSPVGGIADDFDGNARSAGTPDIGADEFTGIGADFTPPSISYTALSAACSTGDRTLSGVSIVDGSGVPITGALVPRIYYRKGAGTWYSKPGTLSTGTGTNGTWSFNIAVADMGGVVFGNTISYYIVAQDIAATPNIVSSPSGVTATNVNTVSAAPATPNTYAIGMSLSGPYNVGASGTFTTLTDAVSVYNGCPVTGPVTFNLTNTDYSSETMPIVIGENTGASATNTLTIKPATGINATISAATGTVLTSILKLDGADYVIIDGVNNGTTSFTLENTSATPGTAVVWLNSKGVGAGASNNVIKNLNIKAGIAQNAAITATYGIVIAGNTLDATVTNIPAGDDNDNNIIQGNNITKVRYGVYTRGGSTTNANTGTIIRNNIIGPAAFGADAIGKSGILVREEDGIKIDSNEIRFIGGDYNNTSGGTDRIGIAFATDAAWPAPTSVYVKNATVTRNLIHDLVEERTFAASAIVLAGVDGTNATNNIVANNMVYNILANGTSADYLAAVGINSGKGDKVVFNTINLVGDCDPTAGATATGTSGSAISIGSTTVTDLTLKNNNVFLDVTSSSSTALKFAVISIPASFAWGAGGMNYNNWYANPGNAVVNVGSIGGTFSLALAGWQTATSQDANSKSVDPLFVSPTDLHLQSSSSLDNQGTPIVGITNDFDNNTRNAATPDIGADEFNNSNCTGAVGGTAVATKLTVCAGDSSLLSVTGYSSGLGSGYQWQTSANNTTWNDSTGQVAPGSFNTGALSATRYFRLKVTCPSGTATAYSNVITVTVNALPTVTVSPAGPIALCTPATQLLSITGTSAASPSYQWQRNGTDIASGATNATYDVSESGTYTVKVTSGVTTCVGTSANVVVTVNQSPSPVTITPNAASLCHTTSPAQLLTVSGGTVSGIVILSDNFNTTNSWAKTNTSTGTTPAAADWTLRPDGHVYGTTPVTFHSNDNSQFYITNSDAIGTGASTSTSLITPSFSTVGFTACNLKFYQFFRSRLVSNCKVDVSTDGGANWTTLQTYTGTDVGTATAFAETNISLNAYVGNASVSVRFLFTAGWDWYWAIDNLSITGDQTASTIWSPITGLYTNAAATIAYTGTATTTVYAKPTATTTYTATVTSAANCPRTQTVTITSNCNVPVTLLNFRGDKQGSVNNLSWTTVTEANSAGFELERSADGINFSSIIFVASKAVNGTSNTSINYGFVDGNPFTGNSYYRLKQIDKDGKSTYSQVVLLKGSRVTQIDITAIYPNPASHVLNLVVTSPATDKVTVVVTDIAGKVLLQQTASLTNGDNVMQLNVSNLASGTYLIKATCQNGCDSNAKKFVKN